MENAHKVLASGKDLEAVETDLDIAQVTAAWGLHIWALVKRRGMVKGMSKWTDRRTIVFITWMDRWVGDI